MEARVHPVVAMLVTWQDDGIHLRVEQHVLCMAVAAERSFTNPAAARASRGEFEEAPCAAPHKMASETCN
eukprot:4683730-Pyramimonas_sp.AAC.1